MRARAGRLIGGAGSLSHLLVTVSRGDWNGTHNLPVMRRKKIIIIITKENKRQKHIVGACARLSKVTCRLWVIEMVKERGGRWDP